MFSFHIFGCYCLVHATEILTILMYHLHAFSFCWPALLRLCMCYISLITPSKYSVPQRMLLLEESLKKVDTSNTFAVCGIIDHFAQQPSLKESSSLNR